MCLPHDPTLVLSGLGSSDRAPHWKLVHQAVTCLSLGEACSPQALSCRHQRWGCLGPAEGLLGEQQRDPKGSRKATGLDGCTSPRWGSSGEGDGAVSPRGPLQQCHSREFRAEPAKASGFVSRGCPACALRLPLAMAIPWCSSSPPARAHPSGDPGEQLLSPFRPCHDAP